MTTENWQQFMIYFDDSMSMETKKCYSFLWQRDMYQKFWKEPLKCTGKTLSRKRDFSYTAS